MKTINVSTRSKTLTNLLKQVKNGGVILRTSDGKLFALTALKGWEGFEVGNSKDFREEVKRTSRNKDLMRFLSERKHRSKGKLIPISKVRQRLGLDE